MRAVLGIVHAFLYMMTVALTYAYYAHVRVEIPEWAYGILGLAVIGVSVVIAVGHIVGGGIMGMTAGGIWDGMRLGLTLGLGVALGRLWPYAGIVAAVAFITKAPTWHWATALGAAVLFFGIQRFVGYVWTSFDK